MDTADSLARRRWITEASASLVALGASKAPIRGEPAPPTATTSRRIVRLCTFGDSVLDCRRYNDEGVDPGQLIVRNDDRLFPEFRERDLQHRGTCRLDHRAVDGATSGDLPGQGRGLARLDGTVAIVSVGGNDLLRGLAGDRGPGMQAFEATLQRFASALPVRPVLLATVYDPTFGDDSRNFTGVPPSIARANHRRVNAIIGEIADRYGRLADVHRHFLTGDPSWFTRTIEPSLRGASEVRRVFLDAIDRVPG